MIHVVAIITAKPGQRTAILSNFAANRPAVLAEAGCIEYGAAVDVENMGTAAYGPDAFVVIEKWESEDALKAHAAAPHMAAYGAKVKDLVASPGGTTIAGLHEIEKGGLRACLMNAVAAASRDVQETVSPIPGPSGRCHRCERAGRGGRHSRRARQGVSRRPPTFPERSAS